MAELKKDIIPCICTICGIRNDYSHEQGLCQNGHDSWLEFSDLVNASSSIAGKPFKQAMKATGLTAIELHDAFMNKEIKLIKIIKPTQL